MDKAKLAWALSIKVRGWAGLAWPGMARSLSIKVRGWAGLAWPGAC